MKRAFRKKFRPSWPEVAKGDAKPPWNPSMSDGCSFVKDYPETSHCCGGWGGHDEAYYYARGGWRGRMRADRRYRECQIAAGKPGRAWVRWLGVRLGGWIAWYT